MDPMGKVGLSGNTLAGSGYPTKQAPRHQAHEWAAKGEKGVRGGERARGKEQVSGREGIGNGSECWSDACETEGES